MPITESFTNGPDVYKVTDICWYQNTCFDITILCTTF